MKKLSICVPTYNRAHLIEATLETILEQSYSDFDLVVVDNNSQDNTEEVVKKIRDPRLRYVRNPVNVGLILNQNRCIEEGTGELIAVYHDDDFYHRDLVKQSIEILERHPRVGIVCCAVDEVDPFCPERLIRRDVQPWREVNPGRQIRRLLLHRWDSPITAPTAMVRRSCYEQAGVFRPEFGGGADRELWLRILRTWDLGYISEPMAKLRARVKEISPDPARAAAWSAGEWQQLTGSVRIQRVHFQEEFHDSRMLRLLEESRLRFKTFRELWRWGLLMLAKGRPELYRPGPAAFREVGLHLSADLFTMLIESRFARAGLPKALKTYQTLFSSQQSARAAGL